MTEIQHLEEQVAALQRKLVFKDEHIQDQSRIIQELRGLGGERTLDRLVSVARIELGSLSGGYDDDHDGVDEGVVVYLQLLDRDGDAIKATGSVQIRLYDLANPVGSQLMGEVSLGSEALRQHWYGRFMTYHYTVRVPWGGGAARAAHKSITVHARFSCLLSGQTSETQEVVDVSGTASPTGDGG